MKMGQVQLDNFGSEPTPGNASALNTTCAASFVDEYAVTQDSAAPAQDR